jgi:DNA-binding CsgD family transcriptional regulator
VEAGDSDPEIGKRLEERRAERRDFVKSLEDLSQTSLQPVMPPSEDWMREQLTKLEQVLRKPTPAASKSLHALVGGQIVVKEIREEGRQRHYLQGQFMLQAGRLAQAALATGNAAVSSAPAPNELCEQVTIDFLDPNPLDALAEQAMSYLEEGLLCKEIAGRMSCSKSQVTKLIKHWYESQELKMPDGRTRRSTLKVKHTDPPLYQQLADSAMEQWQKGLLLQDIAAALGCDRNTVTAALKFAHESRGLPYLDGRHRRKNLHPPDDETASGDETDEKDS